ncbi:Aste57867_664 [Aphanomyces stellatus]|uniref:Aste57867_664 protein n=1 Tax=Aphanomyces stellatus TaxID=120398 RepID=A0A485K6F7_9STRA|nr:hypothetical protein As57867_000663 [Aphanomyces stellatus]VFT77889.1 Aste57867_664 [Aphanomyces stellatus]
MKTRAWTCKGAPSLSEMLDIACRLVVKEFNGDAKAKKIGYRLMGVRMSMLEPVATATSTSKTSGRQRTLDKMPLVPPPPPSPSKMAIQKVKNVVNEEATARPTHGAIAPTNSTTYEPCPICGHEFDVRSVFLVNEHIDRCLGQGSTRKKTDASTFHAFFQGHHQ